ncbi:flagellar assembly protein A [Alkalicoccus chagannorensis]|uniref:flagellar assembly protein A n=1 Tax=Alkalicoccus chagannorensis TaxID=427072 RepID=UPI00040043F3|nr:FapA family protein [Alkalicoccus chagannorensis]
MKSSDIFTGSTVAEAAASAAEAFGVSVDHLEFEVIQEGKDNTSFFKFQRARAKIRITRKPQKEKEAWEKILDEQLNTTADDPQTTAEQTPTEGRAWIQEGRLYYHVSEEKNPVLRIPAEMTVTRNGETVEKQTVIREGDTFEFDVSTEAKETNWSLRIDKDKQIVTLHVEPGAAFTAHMEDQPPAEELHLRYQLTETPVNQLSPAAVKDQLGSMEVVHGIDDNAIEEAASALDSTTVTVARGELPVHGQHGRVDFTIDLEPKKTEFHERHDGTVDFRDSIYIPTIESGIRMASIIEPTPGEDGISLFGEMLKARPGKPIRLTAGEGIELDDTNGDILTSLSGRPMVEQRGQTIRLSILPLLQHRGNVDLKNGNIRFIGDVEIGGSVTQQMMVEAAGDIWVQETVEDGYIQARGSIMVGKSALNARLSAGRSSALYQELFQYLRHFLTVFRPFKTAFQQVIESDSFRASYSAGQGWGPLVRAMQEKKFPDVYPRAEKLKEYIVRNGHVLDDSWRRFADDLHTALLSFHHKERPEEDLMVSIERRANQSYDMLRMPSSGSSRIAIRYAANSELYSDGEIDVLGKGVMHSTLFADGNVTIHQKCIGGHVHGDESVTIKEAGSSGGVKTFVKTGSAGYIRIDYAHADVVLEIGEQRKLLDRDYDYLYAFMNKDGLLEIKER